MYFKLALPTNIAKIFDNLLFNIKTSSESITYDQFVVLSNALFSTLPHEDRAEIIQFAKSKNSIRQNDENHIPKINKKSNELLLQRQKFLKPKIFKNSVIVFFRRIHQLQKR